MLLCEQTTKLSPATSGVYKICQDWQEHLFGKIALHCFSTFAITQPHGSVDIPLTAGCTQKHLGFGMVTAGAIAIAMTNQSDFVEPSHRKERHDRIA